MLKFHPNKMKKVFFTFLKFCINGICIAFVIWQISECLIKYAEKPQGTRIQMKKSSQVPFPNITVCIGFNDTYLQNYCGIDSVDYVSHGKWATKNNSNCSDPEKLLDSIVYKVEDVIGEVKFKYWNTDKDSNWNKIEDWYQFDAQEHGRCFTLQPSEEHTQLGIKVKLLKLHAESYIFIHDNGRMYFGGARKDLEFNTNYELSFNWEFYDLIDYGGDVCNHDKDYSQYFCTDLAVQEELLRKFGCTSPFVSNKSKICTNENEGKMIMETIPKLYGTRFYGGCYNPCSYSEITPAEEIGTYTESEFILVNLQFKDIIKVTKSYFIYSTLSMIAEIGGYVGLFLGISVNMVINLLEYIIAKIERFQDLKNL